VNNSFTRLQGQYLAYIVMYTKLHRRPPAEADLQHYFGVTPPSIHNMILTLERRGLITRNTRSSAFHRSARAPRPTAGARLTRDRGDERVIFS